jgi:hypothetical protein
MDRLQRQQQRFDEWLKNMSHEEYGLGVEVSCFEKRYFADLRLQSKAIEKRLLTNKTQGLDGHPTEVGEDARDPRNEGLDEWIFRFRRFRNQLYGYCDPKRKTILIRPGLGDPEHRATLVHEMIHAYESQLSPQFAEWLIVYLYQLVSRRIPRCRLDRYIDASTHLLIHQARHGILFLLKSLDLDLRLGLKLGTVFGYGRDDIFAMFR